MAPHVVVIGNIGAGKSTLVARLSAELGLPAAPEGFSRNPFLEAFYAAPRAWAFQSQAWFTVESIDRHLRVAADPAGGVQEQMPSSTQGVMTRALHTEGHLSDEEVATLGRLVDLVGPYLAPPDLVIRLTATVGELRERIRARGRAFEQDIGTEYLQRIEDALSELAGAWSGPLLTLDTEAVDIRGDAGLATVTDRVRAALG